jgi:hypothetical protein
VGLLVVCFAHLWMRGTAEIYGALLGSAFDLHRAALYKSLRSPLPANPAEEREIGAQLTAYLWRGSDKSKPIFTPSEK